LFIGHGDVLPFWHRIQGFAKQRLNPQINKHIFSGVQLTVIICKQWPFWVQVQIVNPWS
jgi:hypothetical protein